MKIDLNRKFRDIDDKVEYEMVRDEDEEGTVRVDPQGNFFMKRGRELTLKLACIHVLTNPPVERDERGQPKELKGETKLEYAMFAQRIHKVDGLFEMSADEIHLLKKLIDKTYRMPLIYKQACEALDPHSIKPPKEEEEKEELSDNPENN